MPPPDPPSPLLPTEAAPARKKSQAAQTGTEQKCARSIQARGVVQGVGFRPFVFRQATARGLAGWVLNGEEGVEIFVEGPATAIDDFLRDLRRLAPVAAVVETVEVRPAAPAGLEEFTIAPSRSQGTPSTRISPDLPVCADCLRELFDPADPRAGYPYINCTACGPRYSIVLALPYDRPSTTMRSWPMDRLCANEYEARDNRRFHAQPVACARCGPHYWLRYGSETAAGDTAAIERAAGLLSAGRILAVKGLGGYHLACDARQQAAVAELRQRKFRKEKPFALMVKDLDVARSVVRLTAEAAALLSSAACPIVLAPKHMELDGVAPGFGELGVMLPSTPLHHLLFAAGAPEILVMTSANRSSEPIAYQDQDAFERLGGIADGFLVGERPIARRVDDSVARAGCCGSMILRRARGYAPGAVSRLRTSRPILATGADLKNSITLVVEGQALVSQHIGDLDHFAALGAFETTVRDLLEMYGVAARDLLVAHDRHPQYVSTLHALSLPARAHAAVQHHRAHIYSVLAEQQAWERPVLGVACDGTGFGDDGAIWGGEFFAGSLRAGLRRVGHLRPARLPGGDAAARFPEQAAAGFLEQLPDVPDLSAPPFLFSARYPAARRLLRAGLRSFATTSMGRLFDAAAALTGFSGAITFEGQAAMWLEQQAQSAGTADAYPFRFSRGELDFRPLLRAILQDRQRGRDPAVVARAFHQGVARGLAGAILTLCGRHGLNTVVLSGGVFQNELLLASLREMLAQPGLTLWTNHSVPPNDGGISLGQAAWAAEHPECMSSPSR